MGKAIYLLLLASAVVSVSAFAPSQPFGGGSSLRTQSFATLAMKSNSDDTHKFVSTDSAKKIFASFVASFLVMSNLAPAFAESRLVGEIAGSGIVFKVR